MSDRVCAHCGKRLTFFLQLSGDGKFCSAVHRKRYQEEMEKLALEGLARAERATKRGTASAQELKQPVAAPPEAAAVQPEAPPPPMAPEVLRRPALQPPAPLSGPRRGRISEASVMAAILLPASRFAQTGAARAVFCQLVPLALTLPPLSPAASLSRLEPAPFSAVLARPEVPGRAAATGLTRGTAVPVGRPQPAEPCEPVVKPGGRRIRRAGGHFLDVTVPPHRAGSPSAGLTRLAAGTRVPAGGACAPNPRQSDAPEPARFGHPVEVPAFAGRVHEAKWVPSTAGLLGTGKSAEPRPFGRVRTDPKLPAPEVIRAAAPNRIRILLAPPAVEPRRRFCLGALSRLAGPHALPGAEGETQRIPALAERTPLPTLETPRSAIASDLFELLSGLLVSAAHPGPRDSRRIREEQAPPLRLAGLSAIPALLPDASDPRDLLSRANGGAKRAGNGPQLAAPVSATSLPRNPRDGRSPSLRVAGPDWRTPSLAQPHAVFVLSEGAADPVATPNPPPSLFPLIDGRAGAARIHPSEPAAEWHCLKAEPFAFHVGLPRATAQGPVQRWDTPPMMTLGGLLQPQQFACEPAETGHSPKAEPFAADPNLPRATAQGPVHRWDAPPIMTLCTLPQPRPFVGELGRRPLAALPIRLGQRAGEVSGNGTPPATAVGPLAGPIARRTAYDSKPTRAHGPWPMPTFATRRVSGAGAWAARIPSRLAAGIGPSRSADIPRRDTLFPLSVPAAAPCGVSSLPAAVVRFSLRADLGNRRFPPPERSLPSGAVPLQLAAPAPKAPRAPIHALAGGPVAGGAWQRRAIVCSAWSPKGRMLPQVPDCDGPVAMGRTGLREWLPTGVGSRLDWLTPAPPMGAIAREPAAGAERRQPGNASVCFCAALFGSTSSGSTPVRVASAKTGRGGILPEEFAGSRPLPMPDLPECARRTTPAGIRLGAGVRVEVQPRTGAAPLAWDDQGPAAFLANAAVSDRPPVSRSKKLPLPAGPLDTFPAAGDLAGRPFELIGPRTADCLDLSEIVPIGPWSALADVRTPGTAGMFVDVQVDCAPASATEPALEFRRIEPGDDGLFVPQIRTGTLRPSIAFLPRPLGSPPVEDGDGRTVISIADLRGPGASARENAPPRQNRLRGR